MAEARGTVVVWDHAVRAVHWLLVILVAFSWWSAEEGHLDWHTWSGIAVFALLVFRLVWGLVGSETARFASFVKGPRAVRDYLGGRAPERLGHNPLGALSVLALLAVLVAQVGLGLFASDTDGLYSGPLSRFVDYETSMTIGEWHHDLFDMVLILVGLHIAAILFYLLFRRQNLIGPMVTGRTTSGLSEPRRAPPLRAVLLALAVAALAWWVSTGLKGL